MRRPHTDAMRRPAAVATGEAHLVHARALHQVVRDSRSAASRFSTPGGRPAPPRLRRRMYASIGVSGEGFMITVHPASSAGASLIVITSRGRSTA